MITIVLSITIIFHLCLGLFVLLKNPKNRTHQIFFGIALGMVIWTTGVTFMTVVDSVVWKLWLARTAFAGAMMLPTLFLAFSYFFPNKRTMSSFVRVLFVLGGVFFSFFPLTISSITAQGEFAKTFFSARIFPIFMISYLTCAGYNFVNGYKNASQEEKQKLKYFFTGLFIAIAVGMTTNLFIPILTGSTRLKEVGPLASIVFSMMTAYAIARFEFLEMYITLKRSNLVAMGYALMMGVVTIIALVIIFIEPRFAIMVPILCLLWGLIYSQKKYFQDKMAKMIPLADFRLAEFLHFHFYKPKNDMVKKYLISAQRVIKTVHANIDIAVSFGHENSFYSLTAPKKTKWDYRMLKSIYKRGYANFDPFQKRKKIIEKIIAAYCRVRAIEYIFFFEGEKYVKGMVLCKRVEGELITKENKQETRRIVENLASDLEGAHEYERIVLRTKIMEYRRQRGM